MVVMKTEKQGSCQALSERLWTQNMQEEKDLRFRDAISERWLLQLLVANSISFDPYLSNPRADGPTPKIQGSDLWNHLFCKILKPPPPQNWDGESSNPGFQVVWAHSDGQGVLNVESEQHSRQLGSCSFAFPAGRELTKAAAAASWAFAGSKRLSAQATLTTNPSAEKARRSTGIINGRCPELTIA